MQAATGVASLVANGREKYLALFKLVSEADDHVSVVFDGRRRSNALFQIAGAVVRGMLTEKELARFSTETQDRVRRLTSA